VIPPDECKQGPGAGDYVGDGVDKPIRPIARKASWFAVLDVGPYEGIPEYYQRYPGDRGRENAEVPAETWIEDRIRLVAPWVAVNQVVTMGIPGLRTPVA
jgi:hypothetical protein